MSLLTGTRVLDFGRIIAGPFCAALLGDHGTDVVVANLPPATLQQLGLDYETLPT